MVALEGEHSFAERPTEVKAKGIKYLVYPLFVIVHKAQTITTPQGSL